MPKRRRPPSYRLHKARNCGVVTIDGQDHYLGPYNSPESWEKYYRLLAEWAANGRAAPVVSREETLDLTVNELIAAYWRFARKWYVKNGSPTDAIYGIRVALRMLRELYGTTPVRDFGPLKLDALLTHMVEAGWSRRYCNDHLGRIKRVFRWGKSKELVPTNVYQDLLTVPGLRAGRTTARESEPITAVSEELIAATLPHLTPVVADMIRFQRATGARPSEVCIVRPVDIDRSGEVWEYRPASHKTQHRGRERVVYIGPRAQAILRPYLLRPAEEYCFSPREAVRQHRARLRANRKSKRTPTQSPGRGKAKPKRAPGTQYTKDSYRVAIQRACRRAGLEQWSPNQLRHAAGTQARALFGLEAAQVILGHAKADVTQIYAERDRQLARDVARKIG
jgi:integrase